MLIFRAAQPGDLDDIMRLIHEAQAFMRTLDIDQWQDGYPSREILFSDIEIGQAFVYADEETGKVASIAIFSLLPEPIYDALDGEWKTSGDYLTIHRMAIDDGHRGSGIAGDMLKKAIEMAKNENLASVRADTHRGNKAMRRFLEKSGFAYCGEVTYPVDAGDPIRVAYELVL
ncbi:MAG: GNAT family N-acetyltransferase [Clostridia bacterium]|nr:GNAT family N-acetyltransferase [Clostridia bacterium]